MTAPLPAASHAPPTILVLPFVATTGGERAYLAEGVSDELVMALSRVPGVRVISRGTAVLLRDPARAPLDAAALVGAAHAVSGRVAEADGRLRVELGLASRDREGPRWSEEVSLLPAHFTAGVGRIAARVLAECGIPAPPGWEEAIARPLTHDPDALDLLLRGRYHTEQRPIGVKLAMQCFDRAIRLDGTVAGAFGALGVLWANFGIFLALTPQLAGDRAREQAQRALAVDPDEPWALTTLLTTATFYDWDLERADALGARLLEQYPSLVAPRQVLLYAHAARGHLAAVRALGREVQQLDPRSVDPVNDVAFALLLCGVPGEAVALLERHAALHPAASEAHRRLGLALLETGEMGRAVQHLERSVSLSRRHAWGVANLACARARSGDVAGARAILAELEERADGELVPAVALAEIHASLGAHDAAFAALERALEARDYWLLALDTDPLLAPLRSDARFAALRARRQQRATA